MDLSNVRWSASEITLQDYIATFYDCFPNIIKITEGFLGKQEIDSVSSSTVIRVNSVSSQKRVIARSKYGKIFSLPYKLESLKFVLTPPIQTAKGFRPQSSKTLAEILEKNKMPITVFSAKSLAIKEKGDDKFQNEMISELILQDTYEETFLLGHPIDKGKILAEEPIMIPMYMTELKLVVAIGFTDRNEVRWKTVCEKMTEDVNRRKSTSQATFQEIFLLDKKSVSQPEPQYNCIEPIYIDIGELKHDSMVGVVPNVGFISLKQKQTIRVADSFKRPALTPPELPPPKPESNPKPNPKNETPNITVERMIKELNSTIKSPVPNINPPPSKTEPLTGFSTLSSVPKDLHHLTVNQICECLDLLNMGQYMKAFQGAQVDGQFLYCLDDDMMKSCLGMNGLHIVKLKQFRDGWRPNVQG